MYYKYLVAGFVAAVVDQEYAPLRYGSVLLQVVVQVLPRLCRPVPFLLRGSQLMATHMHDQDATEEKQHNATSSAHHMEQGTTNLKCGKGVVSDVVTISVVVGKVMCS